MNFRTLLFGFFLSLLFFSSCNPDCEPLLGISVQPKVSACSHSVLVSMGNASLLKNKRILIGGIPAETLEFVENQGVIVRVPEGLCSGENAEVRVEDNDCGQVTVYNDFAVMDGSDLFNTSDFIAPSVPNFVIPVTPPNLPPSIDNAWLSTQDVDYCLWFTSQKEYQITTDANGDSDTTLIRDLPVLDTDNSFEQSTCQRDAGNNCDGSVYYCQSKVSGIVDRQNNIIDITIHRSQSGSGLSDESYFGEFIDINEAPYVPSYQISQLGDGNCLKAVPSGNVSGHMMLLTSKTDFRQILIFQPCLGLPGDSPDC